MSEPRLGADDGCQYSNIINGLIMGRPAVYTVWGICFFAVQMKEK